MRKRRFGTKDAISSLRTYAIYAARQQTSPDLERSGINAQADYDSSLPVRLPIKSPAFHAMRCHFNLINGIDKIIDQDGIEVRDLEQARNEALKALQELCLEHGEEPSDWGNWVLEATDENGTVLFFIALGGSAQ